MSKTSDELRAMLDERGVEYETNDDEKLPDEPAKTTWTAILAGDDLTVTATEDTPYFELELHQLVTAEQAIAATLGQPCTEKYRVAEAIAAFMGIDAGQINVDSDAFRKAVRIMGGEAADE